MPVLWPYKYNRMLPYRQNQLPGGKGGAVYYGLAAEDGVPEGWCPLSDFSYSGKNKAVSTNIRGMDWTPDGNSMLASYRIDRTVVNYTSTTGADDWDVSARSVLHNYRYGFIPEIASGGSCWSTLFTESPGGIEGGQLLLNLAKGLSICKIAQYTMPQPHDLRQGNPPSSIGAPYYPGYTPVYVGSYNTTVDTAADSINDMRMSPDGTRLLAMIPQATPFLIQWNLTVPFDVLGGMSFQTPVDGVGVWTGGGALYVEPSGEYVYVDQGSGVVARHALATPWEISTLDTTPESTLDCSSETTIIRSLFVTACGSVYVLGNGRVYQYDK